MRQRETSGHQLLSSFQAQGGESLQEVQRLQAQLSELQAQLSQKEQAAEHYKLQVRSPAPAPAPGEAPRSRFSRRSTILDYINVIPKAGPLVSAPKPLPLVPLL